MEGHFKKGVIEIIFIREILEKFSRHEDDGSGSISLASTAQVGLPHIFGMGYFVPCQGNARSLPIG